MVVFPSLSITMWYGLVVSGIVERVKHRTLCSIDKSGKLRLKSSFYLRKRWERDISGWHKLANESNEADMRVWFHSLESRASEYSIAHLNELKGGQEVDHDFSTEGNGPW
jgi:hypothetical protein